jgi:hypothetical protein
METGQAIDDGPNLIPVERSRVKKGAVRFSAVARLTRAEFGSNS